MPLYISILFGLTTALTLLLLYIAVRKSSLENAHQKANAILVGLIVWLAIQAALTLNGVYYSDTNAVPPKILIRGILPVIVIIITLFATRAGRQFIDSLPLVNMTYLHIVRIPVEFVLLLLFLNNGIPQLMTFEGRNFDILSGISAPLIAYFGLQKQKLSRKAVLIWNFVCLGLLLNIVLHALFSVPSPMQKLAFDQPNIAVLYFPFSWLPSFIVPAVLFAHLVAIRQLMRRDKVPG